jgi:phosphopantetheinyl transferase
MPETLRETIPGGLLVLWRIEEDEATLASLVTETDRAVVAEYASPHRRTEALAWRAAVRRLRPTARLGYDELGAPTVDEGYISVSHTQGYAAVALSERRCGVDVERLDRDLERTARRYISSREEELAVGLPANLFRTLAWSAKETLYKLEGRRGLDFLSDISLDRLELAPDGDSGRLAGRITNGSEREVGFFVYEGKAVVTWSCEF